MSGAGNIHVVSLFIGLHFGSQKYTGAIQILDPHPKEKLGVVPCISFYSFFSIVKCSASFKNKNLLLSKSTVPLVSESIINEVYYRKQSLRIAINKGRAQPNSN